MRLLTLALLCSGCSSLIAFDVDSSGTSTVQGNALGGVLPSLGQFSGFNDLSFSQSQQFQNNNTNKDHISECHVTKFVLKVTSGSPLDFLTAIDFFIEAPGLPKVHIAGISSIATGATTVDLTLDPGDIAAYAKSDSFSITTTATGHQPTKDTTIEADLTLHINASLL